MKFIRLLILFVFLYSCQSVEVVMQNGQEKSFRNVEQYVEESPIFNRYFFGFQLFDIEEQKIIFEQNANRYFTPASNTKLFTLYTSLHYLQDSLAFVNVYDHQGQKIYQPMGDPSFLHPDLTTSNRIKNYYSSQQQDTLLVNLQHFKDSRFGSGWAWSDYMGYYQTEKSAFPIQSNLLQFNDGIAYPIWMPITIIDTNNDSTIRREEFTNKFYVSNTSKDDWIPFHVNEEIFTAYFKQQGKEVKFVDVVVNEDEKISTIYSIPADSVYRVLMQNSDNHIAEQLLLQASQMQLGIMQTDAIIDQAKEELFSPIQNEFIWADGSGLSRYNLMKPKAVVWVINQLVKEKGIDWIKEIFPAGGQSGTIRNYYEFQPPRVYAKTGTLSNNHCLSGIVQANSGKWYVFSMMNNHYAGSSSESKIGMENVLQMIVELY